MDLLGADGPRGLSHPKVDRHAGVPAGTTSAYYRTRKALLMGIAERISEVDHDDLNKMGELSAEEQSRLSGTFGLATMVVLSGQQPFLTRTRARHELVALAGRDPDLAAAIRDVATRFEEMIRAVITAWRPPDSPVDAAVLDEQNFAVTRFIQGVMVDFVRGDRTEHSVEQVDRIIQAILVGVTTRHEKAT
jgi:AcrR family transcriptional regulator